MLNKVNDKLFNLKYDVKEKMFERKLNNIALDNKEKAKKLATSVGTFVITKSICKKLF